MIDVAGKSMYPFFGLKPLVIEKTGYHLRVEKSNWKEISSLGASIRF